MCLLSDGTETHRAKTKQHTYTVVLLFFYFIFPLLRSVLPFPIDSGESKFLPLLARLPSRALTLTAFNVDESLAILTFAWLIFHSDPAVSTDSKLVAAPPCEARNGETERESERKDGGEKKHDSNLYS